MTLIYKSRRGEGLDARREARDRTNISGRLVAGVREQALTAYLAYLAYLVYLRQQIVIS
jgi:hypothetical protein